VISPEDCRKLAGDNIPGEVPTKWCASEERGKMVFSPLAPSYQVPFGEFHRPCRGPLPGRIFNLADRPGMLSPANVRQSFGLHSCPDKRCGRNDALRASEVRVGNTPVRRF
jgi:hypothetical protein